MFLGLAPPALIEGICPCRGAKLAYNYLFYNIVFQFGTREAGKLTSFTSHSSESPTFWPETSTTSLPPFDFRLEVLLTLVKAASTRTERRETALRATPEREARVHRELDMVCKGNDKEPMVQVCKPRASPRCA